MRGLLKNTAVMSWVVVVVVGLFVAVLVPSLHLPSRLDGGQSVLDGARRAFTAERVAGDRAGITMVSAIVDLADPIATAQGGAADEVPQLVAFVSAQTGLSEPEVLDALQTNFPHTTALLQAIPLDAVTAEVPGLVGFLAETLGITEEQVVSTLNDEFPRLAQSINALPTVTDGWNSVPGTENLTRFDGSPARTVPEVRDYFAGDVIPVLENQGDNFGSLDGGFPSVGLIPVLLLVVAAVVIVFGVLMIVLSARRELARTAATASWSVVVVVGVLVVALGAVLYPRLGDGQELLDGASPAFTAERVAGDRAGITMVSAIVDLADPIATAQGGAADEVPQLVAFVAGQTGLSDQEVLDALQTNFPHTTALLQAIPLDAVTAEVPGLVGFLAETLGITEEQVVATLNEEFPRLAQSIEALPTVTAGWNSVPGTENLTRFDGSPARTVPEVRDYFAGDVIPVLEGEQTNFRRLDTTPPPVDVFAPLLILVGVLVIAYGAAMIVIARYREPAYIHVRTQSPAMT